VVTVERHGHKRPRLHQPSGAHPPEHQVEQPLGQREVRHDAPPQRLVGDDRLAPPVGDVPGLLPHREHVAGAFVERDHRRLIQHDAAPPLEHHGVGGAQIDREVAGHFRRV
jgi:hypothetical protein